MESSFLSSFKREIRITVESLQGNQASLHVKWGILWSFSSCGRKMWVPLKFRRGPQGTSPVDTVESGLLSSCKGHLGIPLESLEGDRALSLVEV